MSEDNPAASPPARRRRRRRIDPEVARRRLRRRRYTIAGVVLGVLVVGFVAWLGLSARGAQQDLVAARDHAGKARAALLSGDTDTARRQVDLAVESAGSAHRRTSSLPWQIVSPIPVVGSPFATTRALSAVVDELARTVLDPAAQAGSVLDPSQLRAPGGQVDLAALTAARPSLDAAAVSAQRVHSAAQEVPTASYLGTVNVARDSLITQTGELADLLRSTDTAATLLPPMLGAGGPRSYFVAFQTNAEARGTGGLVGGFGILRADAGKASLDKVASNRELKLGQRKLDLGRTSRRPTATTTAPAPGRTATSVPTCPTPGRSGRRCGSSRAGSASTAPSPPTRWP